MDVPSTRRAVYAVLALVCATGLVINFISSVRSDDPPSLGTRMVRFFSYFTIESNILVLVVAVLPAAGAARGAGFALAHLDALLGITVTGIVFATILAPDDDNIGVASVLLHYVAPPLALLAWLLIGPSLVRSWRIILPALAWPLAYLVWTLVHGAISDWYPYAFINADELGLAHMLRNAVLVVLLGLALCVAFIAVDRRRARG
jgi:hypothetical protein